MEGYVRQSLPESARNDRYLALINKHSAKYFEVNENWFLNTVESDEFTSRTRTNQVARLAFSYSTRGARYYRDPVALAKLKKVYAGIATHIDAEGRFTWEKRLNKYGYETQQHEHGWRLEPLLLAYIWVKHDLAPAERSDTEDSLHRAAKWLHENPKTETNNRGIVWAAVLTMSGVYFEESAWLDSVEEYADGMLRNVVLDDGEIGENTEQYAGGGPDSNYTYTSLSYIYMYHLWSGKAELNEPMGKAMRWLSGYTTLSAWPVVVGASVRTGKVNEDNVSDCLPYFERLSRNEPFYALLANSIVTKMEKLDIEPWGHIVSPVIWAMLEAGAKTRPTPHPSWHSNRTNLYRRPNIHYALVSRRYQTGITFRARRGSYSPGKSNYRSIPTNGMPLRGLQVWAWGDEYPLVLHTDHGANGGFSYTEAGGINTAEIDISKNAKLGEWEVVAKKQLLEDWNSDLATIITRRKSLWIVYALTHMSTVVVYGGPGGPFRTRWYMNPVFLDTHSVDAENSALDFAGREGKLHYLCGVAASFEDRVEFHAPSGPVAFGFSNNAFRFGTYDVSAGELAFSDASGAYVLRLEGTLKGGNIDRSAPMRLVPVRIAPSSISK